jgi:hypothetical protein
MLTWVDLLALFSLALGLALGYRGGLLGAGMGLGVLLYLVLAQLGLKGPWWGLGLGLLLGVLAKSLPLPALSRGLEGLLGALGGFFWGCSWPLACGPASPGRWWGGPSATPRCSSPPPSTEGLGKSPFAREAFRLAWQTPWLRKALALEGENPR